MKRSWFGIALLLVLALPAGASTFLAMSQEELVEKSGAVVAGRVVEVSSYWNREGTAIFTEAVIEVQDSLLGKAPGHVRVRTFGGEVGDVKLVAPGFPTFARGEKLLLFLEPKKDGFHRVLGYQQGQFRIRPDPSGREMAVPSWEADTARILKADGTTLRVPRAVPLEDLKRQIRETAVRVGRPQAQ
ncbi:MAG TPA: hypothetical protein VKK31_30935 [Thermoanaerobaculia bacterium]|nr:hypothetical protein [Thermoanaerobaculia bacterium]